MPEAPGDGVGGEVQVGAPGEVAQHSRLDVQPAVAQAELGQGGAQRAQRSQRVPVEGVAREDEAGEGEGAEAGGHGVQQAGAELEI